jgi:hypothetical protein
MRREIAIAVLCGSLGACVAPIGVPGPAPAGPVLGHDLSSARLACNAAYPAHVGDYAPHAMCVNAAVERYAVPGARYPDLVRLQEQARVQISQRIDAGTISPKTGEAQMTAVDRAIDAAEHERDLAHPGAAEAQVARVQTIIGE